MTTSFSCMSHYEKDIENDGLFINVTTMRMMLTTENILSTNNLTPFNSKNHIKTLCEYTKQKTNSNQYLKRESLLNTESFIYQDTTNTKHLEFNYSLPHWNKLFEDNDTYQPHNILHRDYFQLFFKPQNIDLQIFTGGLQRYFVTMSVPVAERPAHIDTMRTEWVRVRSFWSFPANIRVSTLTMARVGLYYTGTMCICKCIFCSTEFPEWYYNDDPYLIHLQKSPNCSFMNGLENNNDPIHDEDKYRPRHKTVECYELIQAVESAQAGITDEAVVTGETKGAVGGETENRILTNSVKFANEEIQNCTNEQLIQEMKHLQIKSNANSLSFKNCTHEITDTTNYTPNNSSSPNHSSSMSDSLTTNQFNNDNSATKIKLNISDLKSLGAESRPTLSGAPQDDSYNDNTHGVFWDLNKPKHTHFQVLALRALTFSSDWPHSEYLSPQSMAMAGFFYAYFKDYVRCFHCGTGIINFQAGNDPWVKHARYSPHCSFLLANKGTKFVENVVNNPTKTDSQLVALEHENNADIQEENITLEAATQLLSEMGIDNTTIAQAVKYWKTINAGRQTLRDDTTHLVVAKDLYNITMSINEGGHKILEENITSEQTALKEHLSREEQEQFDALNMQQVQKHLLTCIICLNQNREITFLPCGHMVCCSDCGLTMRKCPIKKCHKIIQGGVKTFVQ